MTGIKCKLATVGKAKLVNTKGHEYPRDSVEYPFRKNEGTRRKGNEPKGVSRSIGLCSLHLTDSVPDADNNQFNGLCFSFVSLCVEKGCFSHEDFCVRTHHRRGNAGQSGDGRACPGGRDDAAR